MAHFLSLFMVALAFAWSCVDGQLRGAKESSQTPVQMSDCGCVGDVCNCTHTAFHSGEGEKDMKEFETGLLEQTKGINKLWKEQGDHTKNLPCSCAVGAERCSCHAVDAASSEDGKGSGVEEALRKSTEDALSLWWAGGGYHRGFGFHGHRGWGHHGIHCARGGYGGCGCHYYGCRCGSVHYGGCGGWR